MAWIFEVATKMMELDEASVPVPRAFPREEGAAGISKWVVFIRLDAFSLMNSPAMSATRETLNVLMNVFCERCGLIVAFDAPSYFNTLYNILSPLIDRKTREKLVVIPKGKAPPGSKNDEKLR